MGRIEFGPQPEGWINHPSHRSFASRDWLEGQVRYGVWIRDSKKPGTDQAQNRMIYATNVEQGSRVKIDIIFYPESHVYVKHIHLIGRRRKRR